RWLAGRAAVLGRPALVARRRDRRPAVNHLDGSARHHHRHHRSQPRRDPRRDAVAVVARRPARPARPSRSGPRMLVAIAPAVAISATVGSLSLLADGVIHSHELASVWRTLWLGDAAGAL